MVRALVIVAYHQSAYSEYQLARTQEFQLTFEVLQHLIPADFEQGGLAWTGALRELTRS